MWSNTKGRAGFCWQVLTKISSLLATLPASIYQARKFWTLKTFRNVIFPAPNDSLNGAKLKNGLWLDKLAWKGEFGAINLKNGSQAVIGLYRERECSSDVSILFFGGSVAWHSPKKRLRRRLPAIKQNARWPNHLFTPDWAVLQLSSSILQKSTSCHSSRYVAGRNLHANWVFLVLYVWLPPSVFSGFAAPVLLWTRTNLSSDHNSALWQGYDNWHQDKNLFIRRIYREIFIGLRTLSRKNSNLFVFGLSHLTRALGNVCSISIPSKNKILEQGQWAYSMFSWTTFFESVSCKWWLNVSVGLKGRLHDKNCIPINITGVIFLPVCAFPIFPFFS